MPILPLDHPEPYLATLGVMLYPATDEADPLRARAYAAQVLAKAFRRFQEEGGDPPFETLGPIYLDAGEPLDDLQERWWGGRATGEVFKTLFALANTDPPLASWKHAIQIVEETAKRNKVKGGRTKLLQAKDRFLSVAHLWAARAIREGKSFQKPEAGYDASTDFQMFLAEAEILRHWGQTWRQPRATSEPPLPPNVWRVPDEWEPPARQPGWPKTGRLSRPLRDSRRRCSAPPHSRVRAAPAEDLAFRQVGIYAGQILRAPTGLTKITAIEHVGQIRAVAH